MGSIITGAERPSEPRIPPPSGCPLYRDRSLRPALARSEQGQGVERSDDVDRGFMEQTIELANNGASSQWMTTALLDAFGRIQSPQRSSWMSATWRGWDGPKNR